MQVPLCKPTRHLFHCPSSPSPKHKTRFDTIKQGSSIPHYPFPPPPKRANSVSCPSPDHSTKKKPTTTTTQAMIPTNNNNCVSWSRQLARPVILLYLLISLIAPAPVDARECYWYTDSLGRRRRRCRGLIPGIIAALVVGFLVIMAFLSLAFVLRRRQRRATLEAGGVLPPSGSNPQVNMAQPPAYPPPSYPSIPPPDMHPPPNLPPPAAYHELEKNEHAVYHHDPTSLQPPPAANLASHHASH